MIKRLLYIVTAQLVLSDSIGFLATAMESGKNSVCSQPEIFSGLHRDKMPDEMNNHNVTDTQSVENDTNFDCVNVSECCPINCLGDSLNIVILRAHDLTSYAKDIINKSACWMINGFMSCLEEGIEGARCTTLDHSPGLEYTGNNIEPLRFNYSRRVATYHPERRRQRSDPDFWQLPRINPDERIFF